MPAFALVAISGCFAPSPPAGAPCDPAPCPGDVRAGEPAHFGSFPVSPQGVNHWSSSGPNPPVLIIDTE